MAALERGGAPWMWCERRCGWVTGSERLVKMGIGGCVFEKKMKVVELAFWKVGVLMRVQKMVSGWEWRKG